MSVDVHCNGSTAIKSCRNCFHYKVPFATLPQCVLSGFDCAATRQKRLGCDEHFSGWTPKPKPRSFLRWLYDTILAW